jgi:type IV secretion system protein VirB1
VLLPVALLTLMRTCAPSIGPLTMGAIVVYESGARPYAIGDNATHRSYDPPTPEKALRLATTLLRAGHTIDVGYAQVDSSNFAAYGLTAERALEPCTNLATASRILQADYARSERTFGPGQTALFHALSLYNSGNGWAATRYAAAVYATAAGLGARP